MFSVYYAVSIFYMCRRESTTHEYVHAVCDCVNRIRHTRCMVGCTADSMVDRRYKAARGDAIIARGGPSQQLSGWLPSRDPYYSSAETNVAAAAAVAAALSATGHCYQVGDWASAPSAASATVTDTATSGGHIGGDGDQGGGGYQGGVGIPQVFRLQ